MYHIRRLLLHFDIIFRTTKPHFETTISYLETTILTLLYHILTLLYHILTLLYHIPKTTIQNADSTLLYFEAPIHHFETMMHILRQLHYILRQHLYPILALFSSDGHQDARLRVGSYHLTASSHSSTERLEARGNKRTQNKQIKLAWKEFAPCFNKTEVRMRLNRDYDRMN